MEINLYKLFYSLIVFSVFFFSCSSENRTVEQEIVDVKPKKIDHILNKIFHDEYPSYLENSLAKDLALESLLKNIDSTMQLGYFNDIPLKVWYVKKNPHGKGALIHFYTDHDHNSSQLLSNNLNFDLIGFTDENNASKVKEGQFYFCFGKNFNRMDLTQVNLVLEKVHHKKEPEMTRSTRQDYNFNLGSILFEIDSLKLYETNK